MIRADDLATSIQLLSETKHETTIQADAAHPSASDALMNYLRYLCAPDADVTPSLIQHFFYRALIFQTWQENFATLLRETKISIRNYIDSAVGSEKPQFDYASLIDEARVQIVPMNQPRNFQKLVEKFLDAELTDFDQSKVIMENDGRAIAIIQTADQSVRVISFPKFAAIIEGELVPLCSDLALAYTPELDLMPGFVQQLEVAPHMHAYFTVSHTESGDLINGTITRGATFQPYIPLENTSLLKEAHLFYPIKRLEQFFIARASDPVYLELTSSLDRALDMILAKQIPGRVNGQGDSRRIAAAVLDRSRLAIEQIYPDDKTLRVQMQNLERALAFQTSSPTDSAPADRDDYFPLSEHMNEIL